MDDLGSLAARIFNLIVGIYLLAVLMRFLLQIARADFYNPVSQAVVRITDPMVRAFRSFIPGYKGIDFSCLVLALVIQGIAVCTLIVLYGGSIPSVGFIITLAFLGVVFFIINIYYYSIIALVIMSFVMLFSGNMNPHPILRLIWQLTEPVMEPVRKVIPPMGGLDISPFFVFIAIGFIKNLLRDIFAINGQVALVVIGI